MATKNRPLIRPNFEQDDTQNRTFWPGGNPIKESDFKNLLPNIPGCVSEEKCRAFLIDVLMLVQVPLLRKNQGPGQATKVKIEKVKTKARALLQSLAALDPHALSLFRSGAVEVALMASASNEDNFKEDARPMLTTPGAFWDAVQNLEHAAACAAGLLNPKKGKGDKDALSQAIVWTVVRAYVRHFGKAPPLSESGWFTKWLSDLGEKMGHPFSAKQAATALKRWQGDQGPPYR